jgi:carboxyl-terminal processing protease
VVKEAMTLRFFVVFSFGMLCGSVLPFARAAPTFDILYRKLEILAQVLSHVETYYVDTPSATELTYGAAKGIAASLDPHSAFFTPEEYRSLVAATEGEYAGVGFEIDIPEDLPEVTTVFPASPAAAAKLHVGDKIAAIDNKQTMDLPVDTIMAMLSGTPGSKIKLQILRDNDPPKEVALVRRIVRIDALAQKWLTPKDIYYVHIKAFSRRVAYDLDQAIKLNTPKKGLILDLRGDPGGLFEEAVAVCDLFLEDGPIVSAIGRDGRMLGQEVAKAPGTYKDLKVVILIDHGSASASEIVAGALQDRKRAKIIGTQSYGKGSVQSMFNLADGSGLKLTVARYVTPKGQQIDGRGIEPDIKTENDESAVKAALRYLSL